MILRKLADKVEGELEPFQGLVTLGLIGIIVITGYMIVSKNAALRTGALAWFVVP
jgi:hypothetical protein